MSKPVALALVAVTLPLAFACGPSKPEPTPASLPPSASAPASSEPPPASPPLAADTGAPPASAAPAASSPPAEASKPPVVLGETKDECTPVGVDFEKRARPRLKECYATGKKKDPNLEGSVKIKVTVDVKGKIKSTKILEKTLPNPVADCMLNVIKTTPFPEVDKCWDASLTIPITFPTPK